MAPSIHGGDAGGIFEFGSKRRLFLCKYYCAFLTARYGQLIDNACGISFKAVGVLFW
jgi:hypothetical protein